MHTGRSRNDQVATDVRLWTRSAIDEVVELVERLPAHPARPGRGGGRRLSAGLHPPPAGAAGGARASPSARPRLGARSRCRPAPGRPPAHQRVRARRRRARGFVAAARPDHHRRAELGFEAVFDNSLDAVADRDFVADTLYACSMLGVHLSRIGEELILWASTEFGFVTLDDGFSTGSSMMPQKKNPDIAELARGKAGRLIGHLTGFLTTLKGLPLTYNKDMQEDKEPLFDAIDTVRLTLLALDGMISTTTFNADAMAAQADTPYAAATDLAEWLVAQGMPFRDAHAVVGEKVRRALGGGGVAGRTRRRRPPARARCVRPARAGCVGHPPHHPRWWRLPLRSPIRSSGSELVLDG